MEYNDFADRLLGWFDRHGRKDLPWQQEITPYHVWVSEIMLQQTQVATVIPYYRKFMQRFPSLSDLAAASLDEVLHLWTGLGYYARARNLHRCARVIVADYRGIFPASLEQLEQLPGIGRSTAGAILAIVFQQYAPILDGNVKRVLARYHAVEGWPGNSAVSKRLWQLASRHTPRNRTADYTQAIMDLGATLCTRARPQCERCPLAKACQTFAAGNPEDYPGKKPYTQKPIRKALLLLMRNANGEILLERQPLQGLWGGLWAFPQCNSECDIDGQCQNYNCRMLEYRVGNEARHTFSHFYLDYTPVEVTVSERPGVMERDGLIWYHPDHLLELGTPAPILKLLNNLKG